jgi:hypothetical protein
MQKDKQKKLAEEPDPIKKMHKKKLAKRKTFGYIYIQHKLHALLFLGCSL